MNEIIELGGMLMAVWAAALIMSAVLDVHVARGCAKTYRDFKVVLALVRFILVVLTLVVLAVAVVATMVGIRDILIWCGII